MANYSSKNIELFARTCIAKSFNALYENFIWQDKSDDFDFVSPDKNTALEVTLIISDNEKNALEYQTSLKKGKHPNPSRVKYSHIDDDGALLTYLGGDMDEIREKITFAIRTKEAKRLKRKKKYENYELCLCIDEGGLFNTTFDFDFILENKLLDSTGFSRLFLITTNNFFVIECNEITIYEKNLK